MLALVMSMMYGCILFAVVVGLLLLCAVRLRDGLSQQKMSGDRSIVVLVLGDVGRSPRMQYHCLSLARLPANVALVGYRGELCVPAVRSNSRISMHLIAPPAFAQKLPRALGMPSKVVLQLFQLLWILLFVVPAPHVLLMQNPPSIPTMFVAVLVRFLRGCKFVVDWHNFGYTLLALRFTAGEQHPVVRFALAYERFFGRFADGSLCVTKAMQQWLQATWGIKSKVLYDRAPDFFCKLSAEEAAEFFSRLASTDCPALADMLGDTPPALVVSSTSWTADEDFGLLLRAIEDVDARGGSRLLFVITGKGPEKAFYEKRIAAMQLKRCKVVTAWLAAADYPRLLGSATLGISLHTSSSGLDLPMKVVDMFGCGLPVCAVGFSCLDELVQHGKNGLVFDSAGSLAEQLQLLLRDYPQNTQELDKLRRGASEFQASRWQDNWQTNAASLFMQ